MADRFQTYEEFWPFYVGEHSKPLTRWFHFIGTSGVLLIALGAVLTMNPWLFLACPLSGYSWAWVSHFFIEKNKPATFKYPLWSLRGDFRMYFYMLTGRMNAEVEKYGKQAVVAAPARAA